LFALLLCGPPVPDWQVLAKGRLVLAAVVQSPRPLPRLLAATAPFSEEVIAIHLALALLRATGRRAHEQAPSIDVAVGDKHCRKQVAKVEFEVNIHKPQQQRAKCRRRHICIAIDGVKDRLVYQATPEQGWQLACAKATDAVLTVSPLMLSSSLLPSSFPKVVPLQQRHKHTEALPVLQAAACMLAAIWQLQIG
jgi:hypothetical protein